MKTYEVNYLDGSEKKTVYIAGENEVIAGKNFSSMYPDITSNEILTVRNIETGASVVITGIQMPFVSMVGFMVKWAIASIPALLILALIFSILIGFFSGFSSLQL